MKYPKRSQYKHTKSQYRIQNWPEYEAGLQRRGDLTVWLTDDALDSWRAPASGKPGGQRTYPDIAIEAALTIRMVFHLPLRQTEGFLRCLAELLEINLPIPDHTTLSRRLKTLRGTPEPGNALSSPSSCRRHLNSRFAATPISRATWLTLAPDCRVRPTASRLNSSLYFLRFAMTLLSAQNEPSLKCPH